MPDFDNQISQNASGPKRAKGDSSEIEQHSLKDQIDADRYLSSKAASKKSGLPFKASKLIPPGSA